MKRLAMVFGILLAILSLNSCINSSSPDNKTAVQIPLGTEQEFKVSTSGISTTSWTLDGVKVGTGTTYAVFGDQLGNYTLKATNGPDSVTWNIEVTKPFVTFYKDTDEDGYGNPNDPPISAQDQPVGYVSNAGDCDDENATISPDKQKSCAVNEVYCLDGNVVPCPPGMVVSASDADSGKTNVEITWDAVEGATHYNVFMSVEDDGVYAPIASGVTGNSYIYVEDWQDLRAALSSDIPLLPPGPTMADKEAFAVQLKAYREELAPLIHAFKKEKRFKVQPCFGTECDDSMSGDDLGQAEFVHTAEFSDVAEYLTRIVGYPLLLCLADAPIAVDALQWPGLTVPGPIGEGEVRGSIDKSDGVYVHIIYDNYTDGYLPSVKNAMNGEIGGKQELDAALAGDISVRGKVVVTGAITAEVTMKAFISGSADKPHEGTIWVIYKGARYSFPLPL